MSIYPVPLSGAKNTLMWADEAGIEEGARAQLRNVAALPWTRGVRVMPDVHYGLGATVGSVIAMSQAVAPAAVGVDIGCGMTAVRTSLHPGGQVGTLGGGNHFIELCSGDDARVWVTLHSGSRGTGNQLAQVHMQVAQGLAHNQGLADRDLAVVLAGSPQMDHYLHDLWWAQAYALLNRDVMLAAICDELSHAIPGIGFDEPIRCHHNYVAVETHDGEELIVTRKGAIRAGAGDMGVIPGSMGTGSYIVRGLGNEASYQSASHGAGRRMSRRAAKRSFTTDDLAAQTAGIECRKDAGVIDEIPAAYKDIDAVIAAQTDLVEVVARLRTLLCVKG